MDPRLLHVTPNSEQFKIYELLIHPIFHAILMITETTSVKPLKSAIDKIKLYSHNIH